MQKQVTGLGGIECIDSLIDGRYNAAVARGGDNGAKAAGVHSSVYLACIGYGYSLVEGVVENWCRTKCCSFKPVSVALEHRYFFVVECCDLCAGK